MISWKELSGTANYAYKRGTDIKDLTEKSGLLKEEMKKGWLNEENYQSAEALRIRIDAKIHALKYFLGGYLAEDYSALVEFVDGELSSERVKSYANTCAVLSALKEYALAVNAVMADAEAEKLRVIDSRGEYMDASSEEFESVAKIFAAKKEQASTLPEWKTVFGGTVAFPDVRAQVLSDLTEIYDMASARADKLKFESAEKFYRENVKIIDGRSEFRRYEYYPLLTESESTPANAMFLYTPYEAEAALAAVKNCTGDAGYLEAEAFSHSDKRAIDDFFTIAARKKCNLIIYGVDRLGGDGAENLFSAAIDFGKGGLKVFLVDFSGTRALYERAVSAARAGGGSAMDISYFYLPMPCLDDVLNLFEELRMISSPAEERAAICKNMPFMGFAGMNEAIIAFTAGGDWRARAAECSDRNKPLVRRYLDNLPSQSLFIEKNWGDFGTDIIIDKDRQFDYDDLGEVDRKNIQYIMQKRMSVFAKCGCIVRYCTLAGADKSVWKELGRETQEERLTKATKLVFRVLSVEIDPEVKMLDKLSNPGAGGLCCAGGKSILYRTDCAQDYDFIIDAICHESYHAFQHLVMYGPWSEWYWTEFGVTRGRKEEWLCNNGDAGISGSGERRRKGRYFSDTSSDAYYVQVLECEARAFAKDCLRESAAVWNEMDFE